MTIVFILLVIFSGIAGNIQDNSNNIKTPNHENTILSKNEGVIDASSLGSKVANVRSEPNEQSEIIKVLNNGTKVIFLETLGNWVHVVLENDSEGWVASNLIKDKKKVE
jgi:uncharacterized protein YgiM (DUF1202 family)